MEVELNSLISHFSNSLFKVKGVYHYTINPGTFHSQKTAPFPGFIFPLGGHARFNFNGSLYQVFPGRIIHGGAEMLLEKKVSKFQRWEYISVLYDIKDTQADGICLPETHFEISVGKNSKLSELLYKLWRTYQKPGPFPAFQTETLFRCVLEELFISSRGFNSEDSQVLFEEIVSYIHEHYMDSLSVRALAEQSGANENRLYYIFNKYSGMGPGDYLTTYRLNRAKELLVTENTPVGIIAKSVGYPDPLYFSRIFSKKFGLPPSGFREKFRNNPYNIQDCTIPT